MSLFEEEAARLEKLKKIREAGIDPYPSKIFSPKTIKIIFASWDELEDGGDVCVIAGRLFTKRVHGGLIFAHLDDGTEKIQIALKKDLLGHGNYEFFKEVIDAGDFIEAHGTLFKTKLGERTLLVNKFEIISKTLLPLPEKWHGLSDVEIRYRKRYLDLISNKTVRLIFEKRSAIVRAVRNFFDSRGFIEVETPILQPLAGGANARPFLTHHNALNTDLYLRIAPELYLKRLIIGGFPRVYEIARCFRNEGIDHLHNPEFTQVEAYEAYIDYEILMKRIEELIPFIITEIGLKLNAVPFEETTLNFTPPYPRIAFLDLIKKETGLDINKILNQNTLIKDVQKLGMQVEAEWGRGKILDEVFKIFVRPKIIEPMFVINHPIELSPLAKKITTNPVCVERFQLVAGKGSELVNAFSELNDPLDQAERFKAQEADREGGDEEAQRFDEDFITALKHGMPPTSGMGMGIDRLTALLTNSHNIKEVILFPTLRPPSES